MTYPTFTLTGSVYDLLDSDNDGSTDDVALAGAVFTFSPNTNGQFVGINGVLYRPLPIDVVVDSDGKINGDDGILLLANDDAWNLSEPLQWQVSVAMPTGSSVKRIKPWSFVAPHDGAVESIATLSAVLGTAATGVRIVDEVAASSIIDSGVKGRDLVRANSADDVWDSLGAVPSRVLPSYVDDVVEKASFAEIEAISAPESGKIFVDVSTGDSYRWAGSTWVRISDRVNAAGITDATVWGRLVLTGSKETARKALGPQMFFAADYGVIGDSGEVPNNNVANLLDCVAAAAVSGGMVMLPAGIIRTSDATLGQVRADSGNYYENKGGIPIPPGVSVVFAGQGRGVTVLKLSPGFPRAFDFTAYASYSDVVIRDMTVDRNNITGATILPYTTVTGSTTSTITSGWATIAGLSAADFANAEFVMPAKTNSGTANRGIHLKCRVYNGAVQFQRPEASSSPITVVPGDKFRGAGRHHILAGIHWRNIGDGYNSMAASAVGVGTVIEDLLIERCDTINVPCDMRYAVDSTYGPDVGFNNVLLTGGLDSRFERITVRDCRFEGGDGGVLCIGDVENINAAHNRVAWYDRILCDNVWHDTMVTMDATTTADLPAYCAPETLTYSSESNFPDLGDQQKFYVAAGKVYRWAQLKTSSTTSTSGTGATATIGVGSGHGIGVGDKVVVSAVVPSGYNGTHTVTAVTDTSVSFASSATGSQTVAGTITPSVYINKLMPYGGIGANFMLGGYGRIGEAKVVNCTGRRSIDIAMEFDQPWRSVESDNHWEEFWGTGVGVGNFVIPAPTSAGPRTTTLSTGIGSSDTEATFGLTFTEDTFNAVTNPRGTNLITYNLPVARSGLVKIGTELLWYKVIPTAGDTANRYANRVQLWRGVNNSTPAEHSSGAEVTFIEADQARHISERTTVTASRATTYLGNQTCTPWMTEEPSTLGVYLPQTPMTIRDATVTLFRGQYHDRYWGTFIGWDAWRSDTDIQGCRFILHSLCQPYRLRSGAAIGWQARNSVRSQVGGTKLVDLPCPPPRVYGRNNQIIVTGSIAGAWSGGGTDMFGAVRPGVGFFRLDFDADVQVSIHNAHNVTAALLDPQNTVGDFLVLAPGSRLGIRTPNGSTVDVQPSLLTLGSTAYTTVQDRLAIDVPASDIAALTTPWVIDSSQSGKVTLRPDVTARRVVSVTTSETLPVSPGTDYVAVVTGAGAPALPDATYLGVGRYTVKNGESADVTVSTTLSQTIDGAATATIAAGASIDLISDGTNWRII